MNNEKIKELRTKSINLPTTPGVYIMHDAEDNIIYVGKAKNLKNRVSSYFTRLEAHTPKTYAMATSVDRFDVMKTHSELEALLLECNLIKEHKPKYNILLKDDKGICYITLSNDKYPVFGIANRKPTSGIFFGPYYTRGTAKALIDSAGRAFLLPECNKVSDNKKPCLCYHIGRCSAPCGNKISVEDYKQSVENAVDFLKGDTEKVVNMLTKLMEAAAERLDFEKAAYFRDRLSAVDKINERQSIIFKSAKNADGIAVARSEHNIAISILPIRKGLMLTATLAVPDAAEGDGSIIFDYLISHYSVNEIPRNIYLSEEIPEIELLKSFLDEKSGKNITVTVAKEGTDGKTIVGYSADNAREYLISHEQNWGLTDRANADLVRLADLRCPPERIEMYDISHTSGSDTVGGMTVFENYKPVRNDYRRFIIKAAVDKDDTAATYEVISRRLDEYLNGGKGFEKLPDLFIADGAEPQRRMIEKALSERNIDVPVVALKKDAHHRTKSLVTEVNEIQLKNYRELWTVMTRLQDEVHRFAISFHKQRRSNSVKGLSLTNIEGIGPKKARMILAEFKTMSSLREATEEKIMSIKGLDKKTAKLLYEAIKNKEI